MRTLASARPAISLGPESDENNLQEMDLSVSLRTLIGTWEEEEDILEATSCVAKEGDWTSSTRR